MCCTALRVAELQARSALGAQGEHSHKARSGGPACDTRSRLHKWGRLWPQLYSNFLSWPLSAVLLRADYGSTFMQRNDHADASALAAASLQLKVIIFGRRTSGPCGGRNEGPQGRNPLALGERRTIISPLVLYTIHTRTHVHTHTFIN